MYAHLSRRADEQRTDIQRGAALVGRDEALVQANHLLNHLHEHLSGNLGHHETTAGGLQAGGILLSTEYADLAVGAAIGLEAFEGFLTVVQTGGSHTEVDGLFGGDFYLTPLAVVVVATNVIVGRHEAEGQITPINFFHFCLCLVYSAAKVRINFEL